MALSEWPADQQTQHQVEMVTGFQVGSLGNPNDRAYAAGLIELGHPIAVQMFGVFGLLIRADSQNAIQRVRKVKLEDVGSPAKPYATMMPTPKFIELIDFHAVDPQFKQILGNGLELQRRVGALCHIRAPILPYLSEKLHIPNLLLSDQEGQPTMQNLDPFGHSPMSNLIKTMQERGVEFGGVTTLNDSGIEPEITKVEAAAKRCQERGISLLLTDNSPRRDDIEGSFAIIDITRVMSAVRDGFVPIEIMDQILGLICDKTNMKHAKYRQSAFPVLDIKLSPRLKRAEVLLHIRGKTPAEIQQRIGRTLEALEKSPPVLIF